MSYPSKNHIETGSDRIYCGPQGLDLAFLCNSYSSATVRDYLRGREIYYTHRCRTALKKACELLGLGAGDEVLVPSYNCGSEIDVFLKAGVSLRPYRVQETTQIDFEDFIGRITKKTKAALITHYFGFPQSITSTAETCKEKGVWLIEDCAHALFSRDGVRALGSTGDMAVFSFPKTLGVPDGGALMINNLDISVGDWPITAPNCKEVFTHVLPLIKSTVLNKPYFERALQKILYPVINNNKLEKSEIGSKKLASLPRIPATYYYDDRSNTNRGMSLLTKYLLRNVNASRVVTLRRRNYLMLLDLLSASNFVRPLRRDLPEGVCPLCFPMLFENRETVTAYLNRHGIRAISWWKGYHESIPWHEFIDACKLKDSVVALPIHQDIGESQIRYMAMKVMEIACHS